VTNDLDPRPILNSLGISANPVITPVSGGWDTSLFRVDTRDRGYALRVFRPEQRETARREAVVMRTLAEAGLPVPGVHAETVVDGRPALLLAWCAGRPLFQEVQSRPTELWRLAVAMGRMHARIHAQPVPESVIRSLPAWTPRTEDADSGLLAALHSAGNHRIAILHLDYHPLNVMSDRGAITGVLDWANVAVGDPRADLARTVTLLRLAPTPPGKPPRPLQLVLRALLESGWRRGYSERHVTDPFVGIEPFYVWAGAMMERDLRPKLGRQGVWLREGDLARIHRWTVARAARLRPFNPTGLFGGP
jgi:aminoglycoside phosphotransferase (APT) family kinase protein